MNQYYTIGQLAKLAGISTKTLRVYERKGLLLPQRNEENDYRVYGEEGVTTLEKIQLMKYLDFSLDQIADFLQLYENVSRENMLIQQKRLLEKKREQLNRVIAHVDRAVKECQIGEADGDTFLKALGSIVKNQRADELVGSLMKHGFEPYGFIDKEETIGLINKAFSVLTEREKKIMYKFVFKEMQKKDIAEEIGMSPMTVGRAINSATEKIRSRIEGVG